MDQLINVLVTITLFVMMAATGLTATVVHLMDIAKHWPLIVRVVVANYVCVPAVTIALLLLIDPHPMVAAGFIILAVCPGAPYGPPFTSIAKGNVVVAIGLMIILAGSSAIIAPILMRSLMNVVSGSEPHDVDSTRIVSTLFATQLLPLCAGITVRHWHPDLAEKLQSPANFLSKVLNVMTVALILIVQFHLLAEIRLSGFVGMCVLLIASWFTGWWLGGHARDIQTATAVTTALRNVSVGLVIATGAFAGSPAVTAVVGYGMLSLLGTLVLAIATNTMSSGVNALARPEKSSN